MASFTVENFDGFDDISRNSPIQLSEIGGVEYIALPTNAFGNNKNSDQQAYDSCRICHGIGCARCTWGENPSSTSSSDIEASSSSSETTKEQAEQPQLMKKSKHLTNNTISQLEKKKNSKKKPTKKGKRRKAKRTSRDEEEDEECEGEEECEQEEAQQSMYNVKRQRTPQYNTEFISEGDGRNYLVSKGPSDAHWEDEINDDTNDDHENFFPVLDPVTVEMEQLAVNIKEHNVCFACSYDDLTRKGESLTPIFKEKWESFVRCVIDGFRNVHSMKILGEQLHQAFMKDVVVHTEGGNFPLQPVWSPYGIIEHFRKHNIEPELQIFFLSQNILEQLRTVNESSMFVAHKVSGRKKVSEKGVDMQGKLINQLMVLWKSKPSELYGANPNRKITEAPNPMLNPRRKVISEGVSLFKRK